MSQNETISTVEAPQNWYFTFGQGHKHPNGYVMFRGTFAEARTKMFEHFDSRWAFQYDEQQFLPQIKKYNLYQLMPGLDF